jgi:hypothetical protein
MRLLTRVICWLLSPLLTAWTPPATWTLNQLVGASDMNTQVRDNLNYLLSGKGAASVVRTGSADYTTTLNTFSDVDNTNLKLTMTINSGRALVIASLTISSDNVAGHDAEIDIACDGTRAGGTHGLGFPWDSSNPSTQTIIGYFSGLSVGSHVFTLQARNANSGSTTNVFNDTIPIVMFGVEV